MFFEKLSLLRVGILVSFLALLTSCSGNRTVEGLFAPNPKLKDKSAQTNSKIFPTPVNSTEDISVKLPADFPASIPRYPEAKLVGVEGNIKTIWQSSDPSNVIINYYQEQFKSSDWQIITPLNQRNGDNPRNLVVRQNDLEVSVSIISPSEFSIEYQKDISLIPTPQASPVIPNTSGKLPEQFSQKWQDLVALGVISEQSSGKPVQANELISRRDYARWLVTANNLIFANIPGKQIRLATENTQPAFTDIAKTDPDFQVIQGLAEAGLIPSPLTSDSTAVQFRGDAPLTREDLIAWKVPLDIRQALPTASLDSIKQTWGFQDAAKIDDKVWRSLYTDFQNGEQANVRRVFGYTTLFHPEKKVTRAEAAATIWYFGYQGDGKSAADALKAQTNN